MYRYQIKFYPELLSQREGINLESTFDEVRAAAIVYSEAGEKSRVKKGIELNSLVVRRDCIEFILFCEVFLRQPTKCCKFFIQQLCKLDFYKKLINASGRLFRGESIFLEEEEELASPEKVDREMTDEEALTYIIKLIFRNTEKNRETISKIKEIIVSEVK